MFIIDDILGGIFDSYNTELTNQYNADIAEKNIQMQRETNAANKNMVLATNKSNRDINAATNKANKDIADAYNANQVQLQNDMNNFNKQMWDLNNAYNSPVQQMQRAAEAGINPNVVFGQPVAASPVQQTSIPSQQMAQMQPYYTQASRDSAPRNDMKYQSTMLEKMGKALSSLGKMPFIKEQLKSLKLDNESKKLDNEAKEFDKWDREQQKNMYENFTLFKSPDGHTVTPEEYDNLSDSDKRKFQPIVGYRNMISDKPISVDEFNNLPDSQKHLFTPEYGIPEVMKSLFHSKEQYETFKSLQSLGATLTNISADNLQQILRKKVLSRQLDSTPTIDALAFMPDKEFQKIGYEIKQTIEEIESLKAHNKGLAARLEDQDRMAHYAADKMERDSKRDVIKIIEQYVPEGGVRDFLISAYAIFKDLK